jgi:hypothetical protein
VTHCFSGNICNRERIFHNEPHIGVCIGTTLNVTISDTSGTPTTVIKEGNLTTNGSTSVSGVISAKSKYDSTSEALTAGPNSPPVDTDRMTIEACVDASTHSTCKPAP